MDITTLAGERFGQYELRELIGRGGMSAVYRAHQQRLDRDVAIKVLSPQFSEDARYAERFTLEARTAATLEHNNIIPVYDYGTQNDISYIVMRLMTGGTLEDRLYERLDNEKPLPSPGEAITLMRELTKALSYAHSRNVIHRDIKSSNVMFDSQGDPYLVDFGIAYAMGANLNLTGDNMTIGTPGYMAPEQWRDQDLTPAVDQYALAVLMYEVLTGRRPFTASTNAALMQKHLNEDPPAIHTLRPGLPEQLTTVMLRALSKAPAARFRDVNAFRDAFASALAEHTGTPTGFFSFTIPDNNAAPSKTPTTPTPAPATVPREQPETLPAPTTPAAEPVQRPASPPPHRKSTVNRRSPLVSLLIGVGIGVALLLVLGIGVGAIFVNLTGDTAETAAPEPTATLTDEPPAGQIRIDPDQATPITPISRPTVEIAGIVAAGEATILFSEPNRVVRSTAVGPDGVVYSGHNDGFIRMWASGVGSAPIELSEPNGVTFDIDLSADGSRMVTGGEDRLVRVWDVTTRSQLHQLAGHNSVVRGVAISPDGSIAASGSEDGSIRLWNTDSGTLITTLFSGNERVFDVDISASGDLLAAGFEDGLVRIFDVDAQTTTRTIRAHNESVRSVEFSPDGTQLVTSSTDNTIRVFDVESGEQVVSLSGHNNDVWRAVFSPDGERVLSGGRDNSARLWSVAEARQLAVLDEPEGWVLGVDFSPDGSVAILGSGDGAVRVWDLSG